MHLSQTGVRSAVHRPTMDVVAIDITLQQQHRYVARGAEIYELLYRMFNESFVEQREEQTLTQSYKHNNNFIIVIIINEQSMKKTNLVD